MNSKFNAIHMALIPTPGPLRGKVLAWDYGKPDAAAQSPGIQRWSILDLERDPSDPRAFQNFTLTSIPTDPPNDPNGRKQDIACSGFTWLPGGTLLVAGGTQQYAGPGGPPNFGEIVGARLLYEFDPTLWNPTVNPNAVWVNLQPGLRDKRWYPTVALGTSPFVYIHRGHTDDSGAQIQILDDFEVWRHDQRQFFGQTRAGPNPQNQILHPVILAYPRVHLLSTGHIFQSGFDIESASKKNPDDAWIHKGISAHVFRVYGSAVRFPNIDAKHTDAVMIMGGQSGAAQVLDSVQICKASAPTPGSFDDPVQQGWDWTPVWPASGSLPSMQSPRYRLNAVLLPDATVLVIGGSSSPEGAQVTVPVLDAERFKGCQWEVLDEMATYRGYHQTTLLLPSGQVLVAGGESRNNDYEVFSPPYMFKPRPQWVPGQDPQENVSRGNSYPVHFTMPTGSALGRVVLMRPGCVTHHFDADQRYYQATLDVPLEGQTSPRWYTLPTNADALPSGYYMIFLVTADGVPSDARWIKVQ